MNIVISANNGIDSLVIPIVLADSITIPLTKYKDEVFTSINGDILIPSKVKELREVGWESYFPKDNTLSKAKSNPYDYVEWISKFNNKLIPLKINISEGGKSLLSMPCRISDFSYTYDKVGNINYSITLKEFLVPTIKKV